MSTARSRGFRSDQKAHAQAAALAGKGLVVREREETIIEEPPEPPYTTAALLMDANQRWHWTGEKVMQTAQTLFEKGWITYPRTDSHRLSPEAKENLRHAAARMYGGELLAPVGEKVLPDKFGLGERFLQWIGAGGSLQVELDLNHDASQTSQFGQDAHEAIRPVDPARSPEELENPDQRRLYDLIRQRSLASQMKPARYKRVTLQLESV